MALTDAQLQTLSDDMAAETDPTVVNAIAQGNDTALADWYNAENPTPTYVFRSAVTRTVLIGSMDWVNEYDPGFKDDLEGINTIINSDDTYDPRSVESRNALNAVFSGAANSKANILSAAVRLATRGETLYILTASGPGGGNGSAEGQAAIATYEGAISMDDCRSARLMIP